LRGLISAGIRLLIVPGGRFLTMHAPACWRVREPQNRRVEIIIH
jgi:hypothetical protein